MIQTHHSQGKVPLDHICGSVLHARFCAAGICIWTEIVSEDYCARGKL